jgi:hypothetical protein
METLLSLISGICWTIVYIALIHVGFKQKTYGMPLFALALNISWECIYSFKDLTTNIENVQSWINLAWFLLDIVIVITYCKFGKKDFTQYFDNRFFIPWTLLALIMGFAVQIAFIVEFGKMSGAYSAFLQNLIMSVLFINMLAVRKSKIGQNQLIAICKWIGTLAPTILFGIIHYDILLLVLGGFCSVFDIIYICMLQTHKVQTFQSSTDVSEPRPDLVSIR